MKRRASLPPRSAHPGHVVVAVAAALVGLVGCGLEERTLSLANRPDAGDRREVARECVPDTAACVTTTQRRVCSSDGQWSEPEPCPNACVGSACAGECVPGAQRCASGSQVQRCSDSGAWGSATDCSGACNGDGCIGECLPGTTECFSPSQLRLCNELGQWQTPISCPFACGAGACGGVCIAGTVLCAGTFAPQRCDASGAWQDAITCQPGVACPPGSINRCGDVCTSLENDPEHCGACDHSCQGGACAGGRCQPVVLGTGFTSPSAVALSETHVYFRDTATGGGRILRIAKSGGVAEVVAQGVSNLAGVALGGDQLYFASGNAQTLGQGQMLRANLDGSELQAFSPLHAPGISRLIVPGLFVYYTVREPLSTKIYRAGLLSAGQTGAGVEAEFEDVLPGPLLSMTVINGCLFYVDQSRPLEILRKCSATAAAEVHYTGAGDVAFQPAESTDDTYLYFVDGANALLRIALQPPASAEPLVSGNVAPPTLDGDALYYVAPGDPTAVGCSTSNALWRASKLPGAEAPLELLPAPLACPTQLALDEQSLYWISSDGAAVLRLAK
jgi:hypothetical protein